MGGSRSRTTGPETLPDGRWSIRTLSAGRAPRRRPRLFLFDAFFPRQLMSPNNIRRFGLELRCAGAPTSCAESLFGRVLDSLSAEPFWWVQGGYRFSEHRTV